MNSFTCIDLKGHCKNFYSHTDKECKGPSCKNAHCQRTKNLIHKLFSINLFFRASSGFLIPRKELPEFFEHLHKNNICLNYYLFSNCHEHHSAAHQHIEMAVQVNKLLPVPLEVVTNDEPVMNDACMQETMACDCKFCSKKKEQLGLVMIKEDKNVMPEEIDLEKIEAETKVEKKEKETIAIKLEKAKEKIVEKEKETIKPKEKVTKKEEKEKKKKETMSKLEKPKEKIIKAEEKKKEEPKEDKKKNAKTKKEKETNKVKESKKEKSEEKIIEKPKGGKKSKSPKKEKSEEPAKEKSKEKKSSKDKEKQKEKQKAPSSDEESEEEVKAIESAEDEGKENVCKRCQKKGIICEFIPCGHKFFCMVCSEKVFKELNKKCSLCFKKIELLKI